MGVMEGLSALRLDDTDGSLSNANGKGGESCSLHSRGGVGENASRTSSSESSISSISMKRPDPFGGVDGRRCELCPDGSGLDAAGSPEGRMTGIALFALGGRPRRF